MLRISELAMPLDYTEEQLKKEAAKRLKIKPEKIISLNLFRRSIDARKKDRIQFICTVDATVQGKEADLLKHCTHSKITLTQPYTYHFTKPATAPALRPVVVGSGPAGLFAAYLLALAGTNPILLERGKDVDRRLEDVQHFWKTGLLNEHSNVQFGEGGAGTFSDGKLNTGTKDPRARKVLQTFVECGAPPEILYASKPHIGTDRLRPTIKNLRKKIQALGGEFRFESQMIDIQSKDGQVSGVTVQPVQGEPYLLDTQHLILAIGHSARDTFSSLYQLGIPLQAKAFSVGARIEHLQKKIDRSQYGRFAGHPSLGAADYKLAVHLPNGRGVYTFCMCPGGMVVGASSELGHLVTNGMSEFARDTHNANSALLVGITPEDFHSDHPLAGVAFQRQLEQKAFSLGGKNYHAPVQRVEDFLLGRPTKQLGEVTASYLPGITLCDLAECFPPMITDSMRQGIVAMGKKLQGFDAPDALLTGVETRSSSPVRILRNEQFQSLGLSGLYPCGEGAGYAGGIISAAVDGLRCAESLLQSLN